MNERSKSTAATAAAVLRAPDALDGLPGTRFAMRENGLARATGGAYAARVFRTTSGGPVPPSMHRHDSDFQYVHLIRGEMDFALENGTIARLRTGDAIWLPKDCPHCVTWVSEDLEFLEIFSPASVAKIPVAEGTEGAG